MYQIIDSTWAVWSKAAGVGTEYQHASKAPPAVQDAVAGYHVQLILDQYHEVSYVPVAWYYPAVITNPALMDIVPAPEAGNTLTPREYQTRWMGVYDSKAAAGTIVCGPVLAGGEWALPVDRSLFDANPAAPSAPHHDYPAWDFGIPIGTPIYAIHAGTVDRVSAWSGNCFDDRSACVDMCGIGLTIKDSDGVRWIYCHASSLTVAPGDQVVAGQPIMLSGNTGHSSGPLTSTSASAWTESTIVHSHSSTTSTRTSRHPNLGCCQLRDARHSELSTMRQLSTDGALPLRRSARRSHMFDQDLTSRRID